MQFISFETFQDFYSLEIIWIIKILLHLLVYHFFFMKPVFLLLLGQYMNPGRYFVKSLWHACIIISTYISDHYT